VIPNLEPTPRRLGPRLVPMLLRLDAGQVEKLQALAKRTRVPQSVYLREAVADLLAKYSALDSELCPSCRSIVLVDPKGLPVECAEHCGWRAP